MIAMDVASWFLAQFKFFIFRLFSWASRENEIPEVTI
jgi:hypothetical protein